VILHFQDNPVLKETVFLKPEWVTEAVYQVVENIEVQKQNGRFRYEQLNTILNPELYPVQIHHKLLELMKKFELCFELGRKDEYIIPELLKGDQPVHNWDEQDNMHFEYQYAFMPAGIITRFIVRIHDLHQNELYWKNGVILNMEDHTHAIVVSDTINRKISIWIKGLNPKGLLAIIRQHISSIHTTLNNPQVKEMIPCNCRTCRNSKEPYYHEYSDLIGAKTKHKLKTECKKSHDDIPIDDLLGEYGLLEDLEEMFRKKYEEDECKQNITVNPVINVNPDININPVFHNTPTQIQTQTVTVPKVPTEKKPGFGGWTWKIVLGIIALVGLVWTCIQIWQSDTVQKWLHPKSPAAQSAPNEKTQKDSTSSQPAVKPAAKDPNKQATP
jgi:hypothetical protein